MFYSPAAEAELFAAWVRGWAMLVAAGYAVVLGLVVVVLAWLEARERPQDARRDAEATLARPDGRSPRGGGKPSAGERIFAAAWRWIWPRVRE